MIGNDTVIIEPGEDGYSVVHVSALPDWITRGRTGDEAQVDTKEATEAPPEPLEIHAQPIPAPDSVRVTGGSPVVLEDTASGSKSNQ